MILNPLAGRGLAAREWPRLEGELQARQIPFELITTGSGAAALARVRSLPSEQPVMAVGGDGTIGALLPALVNTGRQLAIVPLGSGNDYAGMLGLKPGDFAEALGRLRHTPRQVDALEAHIAAGDGAGTRRVLLNGLGMGFDAQVNDAMLSAPSRLSGFGRYLWGALVSVRNLHLEQLEVMIDGKPLYSGPSCLAAVMNGTRYGGGFMISPASDARDGKLNVVASGPINRMELLRLMIQVLRGQHLGQAKVHHLSGEQVKIHWDAPIHFHIDGEACGMVSELQVRVLPRAMTLLNG